MLTVQDCQNNAGELERAAARLHLRSHREAYLAVAEEWRRLAAATEGRGIAPPVESADEFQIRLLQLRASAGKALDSPLARSIHKAVDAWQMVAQAGG